MKTGPAYSPDTSLPQVPALFKWMVRTGIWQPGTINLDIGGGAYDIGTEYADAHGVINIVHDVGNRSKAHNDAVSRYLARHPVHTVTLCNVLNVIPDRVGRREVLEGARKVARNNGAGVFIVVYEGDAENRGRSRETSKGWQNFWPTERYLPEIEAVFPFVDMMEKVIMAEA